MAYKNGDAVFAEDINKAIDDSTTAVNTANTAKTASDKASADVIDLGKQIGTKQGTTVTVGGVAQNAIAFTSDPQTQIGEKEHKTIILYDRYSSDAKLNWGHPSGIFGGVEITNKDFTPYKYLIVYATHNSGDVNFVTIINTLNAYSNFTASSFSITPSNNMHIQSYKMTNSSIIANRVGYYNNIAVENFTNFQDRSTTGLYYTLYYIYKIEGVLK